MQAHLLKKSGDLMDLVDPRLGAGFDKKEVMVTINIALLCTEASPAIRPAMSSVVSMLEGNLMVPSPAVPLNLNDEITFKAMRSHFQGTKVKKVSEIETQSMLIDAPLTTCSPSAGDLYPIDPDSSYWHGRDWLRKSTYGLICAKLALFALLLQDMLLSVWCIGFFGYTNRKSSLSSFWVKSCILCEEQN